MVRGVDIPCLTCPTWSHFIQDKLEISIYLSWDKYKESLCNFVYHIGLIILNFHVIWKTVWILISWLLKPADLDLQFISGYILFSKKLYLVSAQ